MESEEFQNLITKPQRCRLALYALLCPLILCLAGLLFIYHAFLFNTPILKLESVLGSMLILLIGPAGIVISISAFIFIKNSKGTLTGKNLSIAGFIISIFLAVVSFIYAMDLIIASVKLFLPI